MANPEKTSEDRIRELIAAALIDAEEGRLRAIVQEIAKDRLEQYDCRKIIETAITPILTKAVQELILRPDIQAAIAARAEAEAKATANRVKVTIGEPRRW
jgi:hypothetical protein